MALAIEVCVFVEDVDLEGGRELRSGAIGLIRRLCSPAMVPFEEEDGTKIVGGRDPNQNPARNLECRDSCMNGKEWRMKEQAKHIMVYATEQLNSPLVSRSWLVTRSVQVTPLWQCVIKRNSHGIALAWNILLWWGVQRLPVGGTRHNSGSSSRGARWAWPRCGPHSSA